MDSMPDHSDQWTNKCELCGGTISENSFGEWVCDGCGLVETACG